MTPTLPFIYRLCSFFISSIISAPTLPCPASSLDLFHLLCEFPHQSIHFCTSPQSDLTYCANPPIFTPSLPFVHQSYYFFPYSAFTLPTLLCSHLPYLLGHLPCYLSAISAPFCCNSYNFCSSPAICVPPCQFFSRVQPVSSALKPPSILT